MRIAARLAMLCGVLALGACGALPDTDSFRLPDSSNVFRIRQMSSYRDKQLPAVAAEDLVDGEGRCAGAFVPSEGEPGGQVPLNEAGVPMIPSPIALEMTECDVVKRAGLPQQTEIGAGPGGERTAALTYTGGPRPGVYRFSGGRLRSMERGPEPPPQARPAKKPPPKKRTVSG